MEHLTRNTNNDRIINAIKDVKLEHITLLNKQLEDLANKLITAFSGILSSVISGILIAIIKQEPNIEIGIVWILLIFILLLFVLWFLIVRFIIPKLNKLLFIQKISLVPPKKEDLIKKFNYEIMQKIAEINEIVDVIKNTNISECKMLNFVIALYKLQEIVDFLTDIFISQKIAIRNTEQDGSTDLLRYSFNGYTLSAVIKTLVHIESVMNEILRQDTTIMELGSYNLLIKDFEYICNKMEELKNMVFD